MLQLRFMSSRSVCTFIQSTEQVFPLLGNVFTALSVVFCGENGNHGRALKLGTAVVLWFSLHFTLKQTNSYITLEEAFPAVFSRAGCVCPEHLLLTSYKATYLCNRFVLAALDILLTLPSQNSYLLSHLWNPILSVFKFASRLPAGI